LISFEMPSPFVSISASPFTNQATMHGKHDMSAEIEAWQLSQRVLVARLKTIRPTALGFGRALVDSWFESTRTEKFDE
jgi:hypothetical protein